MKTKGLFLTLVVLAVSLPYALVPEAAYASHVSCATTAFSPFLSGDGTTGRIVTSGEVSCGPGATVTMVQVCLQKRYFFFFWKNKSCVASPSGTSIAEAIWACEGGTYRGWAFGEAEWGHEQPFTEEDFSVDVSINCDINIEG